MAKWRNKSMTIQLTGFDELYKEFEKAGKQAEIEGRKCFERCAEVIYDELHDKAQQAGLDENLLEKMDDRMIEDHGIWRYEVGWRKQKPTTGNPLPDTYKVMFYNYGTPMRKTKGGQNRGREKPHPEGSHGFIKKAKLSSKNKVKKIQQNALKEILKGLD